LLKVTGQTENFYQEILILSKQFVIPNILNGSLDCNPFYFIDNPNFDIEVNWLVYKEIIDFIIHNAHADNVKHISSKISYCAYLPNPNVGKRLFLYFIEKEVYKKDAWKEAFINLAAAIYSRDTRFVEKVIRDKQLDDKLINEWMLLNYSYKDSAEVRVARSYQTNWNDFLVNGLVSNQRLKFHIIRDLLGGFSQSNSVEEFSKEFRRFVLQTLKTFLLGDFDFQKELTIEEIMEVAETKKTSTGVVNIFNKNIQ
jgi:hypothetical protein